MEDALSIENLSFSIGGKMVFENISFSIKKGSFSILCGRNGAGKSQLLRCLKGLSKPKSGKILINGTEADEKKRMREIALVFQSAEMQIVSQSVEKDVAFGPENLGLDKGEIERRVENALALMDLKDKAQQRPQTLSGGEMRKCAIAGILAMEPNVILLDEPFANLDYPSTLSVLKALLSLHEKGYTVLTVTHEAEKFIAHTDTLLIMEEGRMVEKGDSLEIYGKLRDHGIYLPKNADFKELSWLRQ